MYGCVLLGRERRGVFGASGAAAFGSGLSSLFLLLLPPFSSWDRLGFVFFFLPCACLQDADAWGRQVGAATACCAFFLSPSVCPGRSLSPLPFSFSFFLSLFLSLSLSLSLACMPLNSDIPPVLLAVP